MLALAAAIGLVAAPTQAAEITLSTGTLIIPEWYHPADGRLDLVVHFHGSTDRVRDCFEKCGRNAALVVVSWNGLSRKYEKPFEDDSKLFARILHDAKREVARHFGLRSVSINRLVVSSFSAGFGALRQILQDPSYENAITDLVMVDTLYAGYVRQGGVNRVDPRDMAPFEGIVRKAAAGKKTVWITYSQVVPPGYASTLETAEYLLDKVDSRTRPASGNDAPGLDLVASADAGGFHVRGYVGDDGPAHMKHLYALDVFYAQTSLTARQASDRVD